MQQFYSVNMSFRRGDGGFDVFTSKKFSSKSSAEKAARRMRKAGFRRSLSEEWKAEYSIVTYTKYGTVFDCETVGKSKKSRRTRSSTTTTSTNTTTTNTNLEVVGRNITMTISDGLFSNYTVQAYGKGFLLVPQEGDENWGTKYFHDGWWMPKNNAWFFRSKYYDFLIENGAVDNEASPTIPTRHVQKKVCFQTTVWKSVVRVIWFAHLVAIRTGVSSTSILMEDVVVDAKAQCVVFQKQASTILD